MNPSNTADIVIPYSYASTPRAVWIGFGALGLVTASLAGALVMKSVSPAATPNAATTPAASTMVEAPAVITPPAIKHKSPSLPATSSGRSNSASTTADAPWHAPGGTTRALACATCGVVESVNAVQQKGQGSGVGVFAGGLVGGLLGHQIGGGNGKTAMTVLGALGGGFAGNEVEKRVRVETVYDLTVRMDDGSTRLFRRSQAMAVGSAVVVDGDTLRRANESAQRSERNTIRTSSPAGSST